MGAWPDRCGTVAASAQWPRWNRKIKIKNKLSTKRFTPISRLAYEAGREAGPARRARARNAGSN